MPRVSCIITADDEAFALDSDMSALHHSALHDVLRLARSGHTPQPANSRLSGRQWDCLRLLSEGASNKQIALRLGIAIGTVKTHLAIAYQVLGVATRMQAAIAVGSMVAHAEPAPRQITWQPRSEVVVEHRAIPRGLRHV
jgi:DNA-binding NarL/FixJ family response regulator